MQFDKHVRVFRNGRNQAIRIPREFELDSDEAIIHKEGGRLIIEAVRKKSLISALGLMQPLDEDIADVDMGLLPLNDIEL